MTNNKIIKTHVYDDGNSTTIHVTEIKDITLSLRLITHHLNLLSHIATFLAIVHLTFVMLSATQIIPVFLHTFNLNDLAISTLLSLSSALLLIISIIIIILFDSSRKRGQALFEELSDELHSIKIHEKALKKANFSLSDTRIAIRYFTSSTSFPLIPSKYSSIILSILNILLFLFIILLPKVVS